MIDDLRMSQRARRLWFDGEPGPDDRHAVPARLLDIAAGGSLDTVVKRLSQYAEETAGLSGCALVLIDARTLYPTFAGGLGAEHSALAAMEEARRGGASMTMWHAYSSRRIVVERNWRRRVMGDPALMPIRRYLERQRTPFDDLVALPLHWHGTPVGVISGLLPGATSIGPETVTRWWRATSDVALALQVSTAIRSAWETGIDHARLRLREELHDTVSQRMFGLSMLAARAEAEARSIDHPSLAEQLAELRTVVAQASSDIRALIGERPRTPAPGTVSSRLDTLVGQFADPNDLAIALELDRQWDNLTEECADDVLRIVRECLRNVVKHAAATRVTVRMPAPGDGMLLIEVTDDGAGFDPHGVGQASFGLSLISRRARERGGTCDVQVGDGLTTMRVRLVPEFEPEWHRARLALEAQTRGDHLQP